VLEYVMLISKELSEPP